MSPLDPSLGDVLEKLIDGIDLSASKQHEIVEGLASQGIVNWQSFMVMEHEDVESMNNLSRISKKRLLRFKDLVMTNIEKGIQNADKPFMYTKEMYNKHAQKISLGNWKNRKNSFKVENDAPSSVARLSNTRASSTVSPERKDETPPSKRNRIEIKSESPESSPPHASSKRQALEVHSNGKVVGDAYFKRKDDDGKSSHRLRTPELSDEETPEGPTIIDMTEGYFYSDSDSSLDSCYDGLATKKSKFKKQKPSPTSKVAATKPKEPQRKPPPTNNWRPSPTSEVAMMKPKEPQRKPPPTNNWRPSSTSEVAMMKPKESQRKPPPTNNWRPSSTSEVAMMKPREPQRRPSPTSEVAMMKPKEPQRKPPPMSKVAAIKTKEQKLKRAKSDKIDVLTSFAPIRDDNHASNIHTVILGTMPSIKSFGKQLSEKEILLRGGSGPQYFGNSQNSFWNIVGSAFGFQRHETPYKEQKKVLNANGYAVWNVLSQAERTRGQSSDSDLIQGSFVPSDLPKFVFDHPNLNRFVFAGNSADTFRKGNVWGDWLDSGEAVITTPMGTSGDSCQMPIFTKFWIQRSNQNPEIFKRTNAAFGKKKNVETVDDPETVKVYQSKVESNGKRLIELIVMPSTSPAYANVRPPEKEHLWHKACFRLEEPPGNYVCPGCDLRSRARNIEREQLYMHWFQDCPYREYWKLFKKQKSKKKSNDIDPFYWYV